MNFTEELSNIANSYQPVSNIERAKKECYANYPYVIEKIKQICINVAKRGDRICRFGDEFNPYSWTGLNYEESSEIRNFVYSYISTLLRNAGFTNFHIDMHEHSDKLSLFSKSEYTLYINYVEIKW